MVEGESKWWWEIQRQEEPHYFNVKDTADHSRHFIVSGGLAMHFGLG